MNRTEKRKTDRLETWFNSLSDDKKQFILGIIDERSSSNIDLMLNISDICTNGALDDVLDVDINDIKNVMEKMKEYLTDYGEYLEKEKNGGMKMIKDQELRGQIKVKIRQLILGKMPKSKGLKRLRNEFNVPYAELSDIWIECKDETNKNDKTVIMKAKVDDIKSKDASIKDLIIEPKTIETKPSTNSKLKLICTVHQIQGKYGLYVVSKQNGLHVNDKAYDSITDMMEDRNNFDKEYAKRRDDLLKRIEELNNEINMINKAHETEMEKYDEIKEVFEFIQ